MGGSNVNNPGFFASSNLQEKRLEGAKFAKDIEQNHRTALSSIDQNIMGATHYPCVVNKKDISRKHEMCEKNSGLPHRPITRTLEAQRVTKQNHFLEERKKSTTLACKPKSLEDCTIIEVEENEDGDNSGVPMFVKHTEAMLDEIDRMEVEMEDAEDPIVNIDSGNLKDPLAVVEYVDDIYSYYKKTEPSSCVSPGYMDHQFDINEKMRAILVDWLVEVHYKFELMDETLFLAINLIDRYLERCTVARKNLQLVGVTAMLLASKYEEVSVPMVDDFVLISDKAYTKKEVLHMEKLMLNTLQFNMSVPTPYVFMRRFLKAAQSEKKLELLSFFIIELCLVEYEMLKFPPSLLAAAAIYTAQCSLYYHQFEQWTKTSVWYTNYSEDQLLECSRLMVRFHQKAGVGKLTGVHRKYSTSKFGYAAKAEPAWFLL